MQVELLDRKKWRTRLELANAIFEYIEVYYIVPIVNPRYSGTALQLSKPKGTA